MARLKRITKRIGIFAAKFCEIFRLALASSFVILFAIAADKGKAEITSHPLEPLTESEITKAVTIVNLSGKVPLESLFPNVSLNEPPKEEVLKFKSGNTFRREAFVIVFDRGHSKTFEVIVDLNASKILSWKEKLGVQPLITTEELNLVPQIVRQDLKWQKSMILRGIKNFESVMIDPWAPGTLGKNESPKIRWIRALSYMKENFKNGYARPIEGVVAIVNMNTKKVEQVLDFGKHPLPTETGDLDEKSIGQQRMAPKPLKILQPEGPSYTVNGHEVHWQKWNFRFSMQPRESLILYNVTYDDNGKSRPILYRASLGEMVVPYGDTDKNWTFRNAFDEGEYGIGRLADVMEQNNDAPENATFFDATFADDFGKPFTTHRAVALYERDGGLLWRHFEFYSNSNDARRGRELVLSTIVTVGNYDYGFDWIFRQDGSLELQAKLTGIMLAKGVDLKSMDEIRKNHDSHSWHLVAPYVAAPHHQHFFNFRIDMDVDGQDNSVSELNVKSLAPGPKNEAANAFTIEEKTFHKEKEARRDLNMRTSRKWIVNSNQKNSLGQNTGFVLVPGENSIPYINSKSMVRKRAGFIDHHFWVTPFVQSEMHAADEYPNQSTGAQGLSVWTEKNRSIENRDVVLWYTFGVTHIPRPEEWPVMSVTTAGFKLLPAAFFSKNPALDVPKN